MADDNKAQPTPVEVTPAAAMPTAEQKVPQPGQVDSGAAHTEVTPQPASSEGLPDSASERTREQFEKLQSQLRVEREERIRLQQGVWNPMQTSPVQSTFKADPLYDPSTGMLNENVFTDIQRRAFEAEERAKKAEAAIQTYQNNQIRSEDERQRQEAIQVHPELDSNSKSFDRSIHNKVRAVLQDSLLHPEDYGSKSITYKEAADIVKGVDTKIVDQAKQAGAKEAIEQMTPKEQASLEATGSPNRRNEVNTPLPDLQSRSRKGDLDAIVERLRKVPAVRG